MALGLKQIKQIIAMSSPWIISFTGSVLAWYTQNLAFKYRLVMGYGYTLFSLNYVVRQIMVPQWKILLPEIFTHPSNSLWWGLINSTVAMIGVHGITQIFGAKKYYKKHNIKSLKQAIIASMSTMTIYYKNTDNQHKEQDSESDNNALYENLKQLLKYIALFGVGREVSKYLKSRPDLVNKIKTEYPLLHLEIIGFLFTIIYTVPNIPSYTISIGLGVIGGEINNISKMIPYADWVYFGNSFRTFWKNWSVPVGEMLRYSIYEPLGGRDNVKIAAPALFMFNNTLHWDFSYNMYGYRAIEDWTKIFVLMGLCVTTEIVIEEKTEKKYNDTLWYKIGSYGVYHAALATALYIYKEKAYIITLDGLLDTFLVDKVLYPTK